MSLAEQMRQLSEQSKNDADITLWLEKIKTAASKGHKSIQIGDIKPFEKDKLEKEGFKVTQEWDFKEQERFGTISW